MDNKGYSYSAFLQNSTGYRASSEAQQAEQSAGQFDQNTWLNQQSTFLGRLTTPAHPAQPAMRPPPPTYGEHISRQQSSRDFRVLTGPMVQTRFR